MKRAVSIVVGVSAIAAVGLGLSVPEVRQQLGFDSAETAKGDGAHLLNGVLDQGETPPAGYSGPVFDPSYGFPTSLPATETRPWEAISFADEPEKYLDTVLAYVLEGQNFATWRVQDNPIRKWYHVPWMGPGRYGREFTHGLTAERRSRAGELGPKQKRCRQNWAVGFYNPLGGYTLGKVWAPVVAGTGRPDLSGLPFQPGTVVAKLLYTQASAAEVPLLAGAPTIEARIHQDLTPDDEACPPQVDGAPRELATLSLLQLDIAVRDTDADGQTGWVFGTFMYDGRLPGADPWKKLRPVGLIWGNDPNLSDADAQAGRKPEHSRVLSDFGIGRNFGRGGRANGPVDNPQSACTSCHMTAEYPQNAAMAPKDMPWTLAACWFRDLKPTQAFGRSPSNDGEPCPLSSSGEVSLDFSLQLAAALQNYDASAESKAKGAVFGIAPNAAPQPGQPTNTHRVSRDEGD